jgi:dTDP-D-glucose 4,6-dehydratase
MAIYEHEREGEVFKIALDATQAFKTIGWKKETTIEEGLRATVEYMQTH